MKTVYSFFHPIAYFIGSANYISRAWGSSFSFWLYTVTVNEQGHKNMAQSRWEAKSFGEPTNWKTWQIIDSLANSACAVQKKSASPSTEAQHYFPGRKSDFWNYVVEDFPVQIGLPIWRNNFLKVSFGIFIAKVHLSKFSFKNILVSRSRYFKISFSLI